MADTDIGLKHHKCENCGAIISVQEPKCPYCGGFNYEGAKRKYFRDLYRIRDNLKQLEEIPTKRYKTEVSVQILQTWPIQRNSFCGTGKTSLF